VPLLRGGGWGSSRWWCGKDGCHVSKRILGTSLLQPLLAPTDSFPSKVLFQIMRINDMLIMPLPFEITTESGRRISERVKAEFVQAGNDIKHSWVTSVANGYFGYSTTPEEYEYQSYEGGSTLYGRYSTPYIAAQLGILAKDFNRDGEVEEMLSEWSYYLKTTHLLPEKILAVGKREVLTKPELVTTDKKYEEDYMYFRWLDVNPSQINFHKPLVHIEVELGGIWSPLKVGNQMINDEGYNMEVRFLDDEDKGMGEYEARWYAPEKNGAYRFVIAERDQQTRLYSDVFSSK
jgi:neutral ceramidase